MFQKMRNVLKRGFLVLENLVLENHKLESKFSVNFFCQFSVNFLSIFTVNLIERVINGAEYASM